MWPVRDICTYVRPGRAIRVCLHRRARKCTVASGEVPVVRFYPVGAHKQLRISRQKRRATVYAEKKRRKKKGQVLQRKKDIQVRIVFSLLG